jgi:uncharacterized Zn finger protein
MEYLNINKQKITCPQCGSNDFKSMDKTHIECTHCGTQVDTTIVLTDNTNQHMVIKDGADVQITDNAKIKIKGGLEIKGGTLIIKDGGSLEIG